MIGYAWAVAEFLWPRTRQQWLEVFVGGTLLIAAYHAFLFLGQQYTTSAVAAIVVSLSPVLTTAFARGLLPDERLSALGIVGLFCGFFGVGLIARPTATRLFSTDVLGVGLIFLAAAAFALGSVLTQRLDSTLPIETMEAWSMLLGAALMHVLSLLRGEHIGAVTFSQTALISLSYLAVVASALGFLIYLELLDRLGSIEINLVSYVAPVFAAVLGWLLLGETIDQLTVGGFLLIVVGFALIKRGPLQARLDELDTRLR